MHEFLEGLFAMLFLGSFLYVQAFLFCAIPIVIQILFSYLFVGKQVWKVAIMAFCTQGIVLPIAHMSHDMINSIFQHSKILGVGNVVTSKNFGFDIKYCLMLFVLIVGIGFFVYRTIEGKMNLKMWAALLGGYLINIAIMVFMMLKFGIIVNTF